jgi:hypothetical protein
MARRIVSAASAPAGARRASAATIEATTETQDLADVLVLRNGAVGGAIRLGMRAAFAVL